jgi:hypothetical protein
MSQQLSGRTRIALERSASRLHTRRRIMRNSYIAGILALVVVWIGFGYYLGDRYPFIAEWSFILGAAAGILTMVVAVWLQTQLEGGV